MLVYIILILLSLAIAIGGRFDDIIEGSNYAILPGDSGASSSVVISNAGSSNNGNVQNSNNAAQTSIGTSQPQPPAREIGSGAAAPPTQTPAAVITPTSNLPTSVTTNNVQGIISGVSQVAYNGKSYSSYSIGDKQYYITDTGQFFIHTTTQTDGKTVESLTPAPNNDRLAAAYAYAEDNWGSIPENTYNGERVILTGDPGNENRKETLSAYHIDENGNPVEYPAADITKIKDAVGPEGLKFQNDRETDNQNQISRIQRAQLAVLRQNVLNQLFGYVDTLFGDYSFGAAKKMCEGSLYSGTDSTYSTGFLGKAKSIHPPTQSEALDQQMQNFFDDIRVQNIKGEKYEIVPNQLYRYAYTMRILLEKPGIHWRTFLRYHSDGFAHPESDSEDTTKDLFVFEGTSTGSIEPVITHFAGSIAGSSNNVNLGAVVCRNPGDKCKFDMACISYPEESRTQCFYLTMDGQHW